jgi:signal transduction histidine kinase
MMPDDDIAIVVIVVSLLIALFIGMVGLLLVINNNRRTRHRAELAEVKLNHEREVMDAEREAQRQTLQEVGRELHDNLGQLLTVVQMGLYAELEEGKRQRVEEAVNTLELSIEEVRRMGRSLNSDLWEHRTFTDPAVARRLAGFTLLQADVTANTPADRELLKRFGLFGPPGILFFRPGGEELAGKRVIGFMGAEEFERHVQLRTTD